MNKASKIYYKSTDIVFRKIGNQSILVPIRKNIGNLKSIFTLNDTASRIWELIDGVKSGCQIRDIIADEFEISAGELEKDLALFFGKLSACGVISEV